MDANELANRFRFHRATEITGPLHAKIRAKAYEFAETLNELIPEGREKSLAVTKLEELMFWANAAIARRQPAKDETSE